MKFNEEEFQRWYARYAKDLELNPNPDDSLQKYDYRAAYMAGATPDESGHWPSQFKDPDHPNRFVGGMDTITGQSASPEQYLNFIAQQGQAEQSLTPTQEEETGVIREPTWEEAHPFLTGLKHLMGEVSGVYPSQRLYRGLTEGPSVMATPAERADYYAGVAASGLETALAGVDVAAITGATQAAVRRYVTPYARKATDELMRIGTGTMRSEYGGVGVRPRAEPFYSQAERAVAKNFPPTMKGQSIRNWLQRNQVKPEEIEWLGLDRLFKKSKVTKDELLETIAANRVYIHEVHKGGDDLRQLFYDHAEKLGREGTKENDYLFADRIHEALAKGTFFQPGALPEPGSASMEGIVRGVNRWAEEIYGGEEFISPLADDLLTDLAMYAETYQEGYTTGKTYNPTKHGAHIEKGPSQNYRELLFILPPGPTEMRSIRYAGMDNLDRPLINVRGEIMPWHEAVIKYHPEGEVAARGYARGMSQQPPHIKASVINDEIVPEIRTHLGATETREFRTAHWDEANVMAHVRFTERVDNEGKRVLFIEELQSDWHQQGAAKGYGEPKIIQDGKGYYRFQMPDGTLDARRYSFLNDAETELGQMVRKGVPDAPFKDNWHELTMKRMMRYASEHGYERIAWTPGYMQHRRYQDLVHENVESLQWNPANRELYIQTRQGRTETLTGMNEDALRNAIGTEAAEDLIAQKRSIEYDRIQWEVIDLYADESAAIVEENINLGLIHRMPDPEGTGTPRIIGRYAVLDPNGEIVRDTEGYIKTYRNEQGAEQGINELTMYPHGGQPSLEGQDITIGGKFLTDLYDKRIKRFMEKYTKKYGGKVRTAKIETGTQAKGRPIRIYGESSEHLGPGESRYFVEYESGASSGSFRTRDEARQFLIEEQDYWEKNVKGRTGEEVWSVDVTGKLREASLYQGHPMFSIAGGAAGIEQDENGNIRLDPTKFALGVAGAAALAGISKPIISGRGRGRTMTFDHFDPMPDARKTPAIYRALLHSQDNPINPNAAAANLAGHYTARQRMSLGTLEKQFMQNLNRTEDGYTLFDNVWMAEVERRKKNWFREDYTPYVETKFGVSAEQAASGNIKAGDEYLPLDTSRGCVGFCPECYAFGSATKSCKNFIIPTKVELTGDFFTNPRQIRRFGEVGDPNIDPNAFNDVVLKEWSRAVESGDTLTTDKVANLVERAYDWKHTNTQLAKVNLDHPDAHSKVFMITKLQSLKNFDPSIVRNLEVSVDPLIPRHFFKALKNVQALKRRDPTMNIMLRIRSHSTFSDEVNALQKIAVEFANRNNVPVLETRLRFKRAEGLKAAQVQSDYVRKGNQFYHSSYQALNAKEAERISPLSHMGIRKELHYVCDRKNIAAGGACGSCQNCRRFLQLGQKNARQAEVARRKQQMTGIGLNEILAPLTDTERAIMNF